MNIESAVSPQRIPPHVAPPKPKAAKPRKPRQTKPVSLPTGKVIQVANAKPAPLPERDSRSMNRMDPDTKAGHALLERWARETYEPTGAWPAKTLLARIMEQGPAAGEIGRPMSQLSEESAKVDTFVADLWGRVRRFVRGYYLARQSVDVIAKAEKVSATVVREGLRRARMLLQLWMTRGKSEGSKAKRMRKAERVMEMGAVGATA